VQLLTLNLARSHNNIVKISHRIDHRFTLQSTPYQSMPPLASGVHHSKHDYVTKADVLNKYGKIICVDKEIA